MRRVLTVSIGLVLSTSLSVGCAATGERVDDLRSAAGELRGSVDDTTDDAGFCLSLARATAAIESGSPETAEDATEEALARAPEEVVDDARAVAEAVREARDDGDWHPDDPELVAAVEHLTETTRRTCAPG
jgi:hypothetical protein